MKIRTSFVTNSSSSSFVIHSKDVNIQNTISTKEELDKYIKSQYGWRDCTIEELMEEESEWLREKYNKYLEWISSGEAIYFGSIDNEDYFTDFVKIMSDLGIELEWEYE